MIWASPRAAAAPTRLGEQVVAGFQDQLPGDDVGALPPDVLLRVDRRQQVHLVAVPLGFLDLQDRVGAGRHRRAGGDLHARAWRHRGAGHLSGEDLVDAGEHLRFVAGGAEGVRGDQRVAVHRRARERRDVGRRGDVDGHDAAARLVERHRVGARQRPGEPVDEASAPRRAGWCRLIGRMVLVMVCVTSREGPD